MKSVEEMIQTRLQKDRPTQMISMRVPVDVIAVSYTHLTLPTNREV